MFFSMRIWIQADQDPALKTLLKLQLPYEEFAVVEKTKKDILKVKKKTMELVQANFKSFNKITIIINFLALFLCFFFNISLLVPCGSGSTTLVF